MTQEAEDAAKWKMYKDYQAAKQKLGILLREAKTKGEQFQEFGNVLAFTPGPLSVLSKAIELNANSPNLRQSSYSAALFDFETLSALLNDIEGTNSEVSSLRSTLKQSGMDFND